MIFGRFIFLLSFLLTCSSAFADWDSGWKTATFQARGGVVVTLKFHIYNAVGCSWGAYASAEDVLVSIDGINTPSAIITAVLTDFSLDGKNQFTFKSNLIADGSGHWLGLLKSDQGDSNSFAVDSTDPDGQETLYHQRLTITVNGVDLASAGSSAGFFETNLKTMN